MNYLERAKEALSAYRRGMESIDDINDRNDIRGPLVSISSEYEHQPLEVALKGRAIELWSDALGERLWLVADEDDAVRLGELRGTVYTAAEARRIVEIVDPSVVAEVHRWKREFNAKVHDCQNHRLGRR